MGDADQPPAVPGGSPQRNKHTHRKDHSSHWQRALRKPAVWVGSVVTAILIGVLTQLVQQMITPSSSAANSSSQTPNPGLSAGHHDAASAVPPSASRSPVKIDSVSYSPSGAYGFSFAFQKEMALSSRELNSITGAADGEGNYESWTRSHGGVDLSVSEIKLVVEGNSANLVRIINMQVIKQCQPPLAGTLFLSPPAAQDTSIKLGFNLDELVSVAKTFRDGIFGSSYFDNKTVSLRRGEQEVFQIRAVTKRYYCQFKFKLTLVVGGKTVYQVVDNHGQPFSVTASLVANPGTKDPYAAYRAVYLGGVAKPITEENNSADLVRINPAKYSGP
jgi:hypothetical protein